MGEGKTSRRPDFKSCTICNMINPDNNSRIPACHKLDYEGE